MSRKIRKGFCRDCRANVKHIRRFVTRLGWFADAITFRFSARFRLGTWHCLQCTKRTHYLRLPRQSARTIELGQRTNETFESIEPAGNYILREKSLVARRERSSRYSAKYRENLVQKILDGTLTIAEARSSHDLTEQDIVDWIGLAFDEQQEKIEHLTSIIRALTGDQNIQMIESPGRQDEKILDGAVPLANPIDPVS